MNKQHGDNRHTGNKQNWHYVKNSNMPTGGMESGQTAKGNMRSDNMVTDNEQSLDRRKLWINSVQCVGISYQCFQHT